MCYEEEDILWTSCELIAQEPGCATVNILSECMVPTVRVCYPADKLPNFSSVQDNCPVHQASVVSDRFRPNSSIKVIPWPTESTDMNPIKTCGV